MEIEKISIDGLLYDISVPDGSITTDKLAQGAVTTDKLSTPGKVLVPPTVNKNTDSSGGFNTSTSAYYCTSSSFVAFPAHNIRISVKMPENLRCIFYYCYGGGGNSGVLANESVFNNGTALFFRVKFYNNDSTTLAAAYVNGLLDSGAISFTYTTKDAGVVERNSDKLVQVGALKRLLIKDSMVDNGMDSMATFGHISDVHGDLPRVDNMLQFCKHVGVDAVINSGDAVMYQMSNYNDYQDWISSKYGIPYLFCIGNHEAKAGADTSPWSSMYAMNMQALATRWGYLSSSGVTSQELYYYKDFPSKRMRVIALNYYNVANGASLGQAQVTWLVNRLLDTPSGYGVIIMMHAPEHALAVPTAPLDKFYQSDSSISESWGITEVGGSIVTRIVDAFISRTTISASYTDSGSVTVNADFSGVDSSIEFIAFANGHRHEDWIGYVSGTTNMMVNLNICAGIALYGVEYSAYANQEDLPRGVDGVCQDAFNIYAIDRINKVIKVVRIGANKNQSFEARDFMSIPYAAV